MKEINLPYGYSFLNVGIPDRFTFNILDTKYVAGVKNEREAILESLKHPLGCAPLLELINRNDKVAIITTDNTRPCPDDRILPVILTVLEEKIPRENIVIIVGLGLHRPLSNEELINKLGKDIVDCYDVVNHDPDMTVNIGKTSRGVPVEINSLVVEADFRISIGFIEPHFFAGFSGGRKSISPGVSSAISIRNNHSYRMLEHPCARAGVLNNNPVHEDMVEQARIAGLDFIVNVLLNADNEITDVFSGDMVVAHEAGCRKAEDTLRVTIEKPSNITLTTNGGAPLDLDFYQTCKAIDTAAQVTRADGIIIVAASCFEGVGPEEFRALHASVRSPDELLAVLSRDDSHAGGVSWQNQKLARAQVNHRIFLFSNLDDDVASSMMVTPIESITSGLEMAYNSLGGSAELTIIPRGPLVLATLNLSGE